MVIYVINYSALREMQYFRYTHKDDVPEFSRDKLNMKCVSGKIAYVANLTCSVIFLKNDHRGHKNAVVICLKENKGVSPWPPSMSVYNEILRVLQEGCFKMLSAK